MGRFNWIWQALCAFSVLVHALGVSPATAFPWGIDIVEQPPTIPLGASGTCYVGKLLTHTNNTAVVYLEEWDGDMGDRQTTGWAGGAACGSGSGERECGWVVEARRRRRHNQDGSSRRCRSEIRSRGAATERRRRPWHSPPSPRRRPLPLPPACRKAITAQEARRAASGRIGKYL